MNLHALTLSAIAEPLAGGRISRGTYQTYGAAQHVVDTLAGAAFEALVAAEHADQARGVLASI